MTNRFKVGDMVVKNPVKWKVTDFDSWGRGVGVGVVTLPPFAIDDLDQVDVCWDAGRCFEPSDGLLPAPTATK